MEPSVTHLSSMTPLATHALKTACESFLSSNLHDPEKADAAKRIDPEKSFEFTRAKLAKQGIKDVEELRLLNAERWSLLKLPPVLLEFVQSAATSACCFPSVECECWQQAAASNSWRCILCDKIIDEKHLDSEAHQRRKAWWRSGYQSLLPKLGATLPPWVQFDEDVLKCMACNKIIDNKHLDSSQHKQKVEIWTELHKSVPEPAEEFKALVPWDETNPESDCWPKCLLCNKWIMDDDVHLMSGGSREHRENMKEHFGPPRSKWYMENVLPKKLMWSSQRPIMICRQSASTIETASTHATRSSDYITTSSMFDMLSEAETAQREGDKLPPHETASAQSLNSEDLSIGASTPRYASDAETLASLSWLETSPSMQSVVACTTLQQICIDASKHVVRVLDGILILIPKHVFKRHRPSFHIIKSEAMLPSSLLPVGPCIRALPHEIDLGGIVRLIIPIHMNTAQPRVLMSSVANGWDVVKDAYFIHNHAVVAVSHFCDIVPVGAGDTEHCVEFHAFWHRSLKQVRFLYCHAGGCAGCRRTRRSLTKSLTDQNFEDSSDNPMFLTLVHKERIQFEEKCDPSGSSRSHAVMQHVLFGRQCPSIISPPLKVSASPPVVCIKSNDEACLQAAFQNEASNAIRNDAQVTRIVVKGLAGCRVSMIVRCISGGDHRSKEDYEKWSSLRDMLVFALPQDTYTVSEGSEAHKQYEATIEFTMKDVHEELVDFGRKLAESLADFVNKKFGRTVFSDFEEEIVASGIMPRWERRLTHRGRQFVTCPSSAPTCSNESELCTNPAVSELTNTSANLRSDEFSAEHRQAIKRALVLSPAFLPESLPHHIVIGSFVDRDVKYCSDIDINEYVLIPDDERERAADKIALLLQGLVARLHAHDSTAAVQLKVGRLPQDIAQSVEAAISSRSRPSGVPSKEWAYWSNLTHDELRSALQTLMWSMEEVNMGYKKLPFSNKVVDLPKALLDSDRVMLVASCWIDDVYMEISNMLLLFAGKSGDSKALSQFFQRPPDILETLTNEVSRYENIDPLKAVKRVLSLLRHLERGTEETGVDDDTKRGVLRLRQELLNILNGPAGAAGQLHVQAGILLKIPRKGLEEKRAQHARTLSHHCTTFATICSDVISEGMSACINSIHDAVMRDGCPGDEILNILKGYARERSVESLRDALKPKGGMQAIKRQAQVLLSKIGNDAQVRKPSMWISPVQNLDMSSSAALQSDNIAGWGLN